MRVSSAEWPLLLLALFPVACARGPSLEAAPGNPQVQSVLDFGLVPVGSTVTKPLSLADEGPGPLTVSGATFAGDPSFGGSLSTTTLPPGQELELLVQFLPQSPGRKTATVTFATDSDSTTVALVELTGTAYVYDVPDGSVPDARSGRWR